MSDQPTLFGLGPADNAATPQTVLGSKATSPLEKRLEHGSLDVGAEPTAVAARGRRGREVPQPGDHCTDAAGSTHLLEDPKDDSDLQRVLAWLLSRDNLGSSIGDAVESAILYVLDGWRTFRFDLNDPRVDSDERRSVGTKVQYHLIENLHLKKLKHPDTEIEDVGVEIKGTIASNWAIPTEGQCGVTLLLQIDTVGYRHSTRLMRTHRAWLRDGPNKDGKRGVAARALTDFSIDLYGWLDLTPNPLKLLSEKDSQTVFGPSGQEERFAHLFTALPDVVFSRPVILTVGANRQDPLRRVRAIRRVMFLDHRRAQLCGQWRVQRLLGHALGFDLSESAWVSVPFSSVLGHEPLTSEFLDQMQQDGVITTPERVALLGTDTPPST